MQGHAHLGGERAWGDLAVPKLAPEGNVHTIPLGEDLQQAERVSIWRSNRVKMLKTVGQCTCLNSCPTCRFPSSKTRWQRRGGVRGSCTPACFLNTWALQAWQHSSVRAGREVHTKPLCVWSVPKLGSRDCSPHPQRPFWWLQLPRLTLASLSSINSCSPSSSTGRMVVGVERTWPCRSALYSARSAPWPVRNQQEISDIAVTNDMPGPDGQSALEVVG